MNKARLLIVEDDNDISNMLRIYFTGLGFEVDTALRGSIALEKTRQNMPHLIVLDIMLPDIDGFEVCRILRTNTRTSHVPIIFLTQKDERSDKLQGLELGADDYITKPFDIEELKLRVQRAISRAEQQSLTDPRSGLPAGRMIEDQLRQVIRRTNWALLDIRIENYAAFKEIYGFVAADDLIRFTAMLTNEVIDDMGTINDFIGHASENNFLLITTEEASQEIQQRLKARFDDEVLTHYSFMDRERGYLLSPEAADKPAEIPFMTLAIGMVLSSQHQFGDIREITELAAEARRREAY
ncbi:MAG: response regulator [Anaerolineales bacterium]|jgi:DNA-binding response OmpR family regulator